VSDAEKSIVQIDDDELATVRANAFVCHAATVRLRATLRPNITDNDVWGTSNRVFGSPHLPVPIPQPSAQDEPIEPCAPREAIVATAWIIAWALTVFMVANVIGSF
jgi:hypothetical protein